MTVPSPSQQVENGKSGEGKLTRLSALAMAVGDILERSHDIPEMLDQCSNLLVRGLEAAGVKIWTFNSETELLELQAIAGQLRTTEAFPHCTPLGISIMGFIGMNRQAYCTNDLAGDICIGAGTWAQQEQIVSFLGYPLVVEDRLVGAIAIFGRSPWSLEVEQILAWMKSSMAIAIDRAWAREELFSRREGLLFRLASQIRNSLDLDCILSTAVHEIRQLLKIDRCHFVWCWTHQPCLAITHEDHNPQLPSLLGDYQMQHIDTLVGKIQKLETIRIDDLTCALQMDDYCVELLERYGIKSQLLLPLETRSGQLGAIVCSHCSGPRPWSDPEVALLQAATMQLAIAIDQAELYAQTNAAAFAAKTQAEQLAEALQTLKSTQAQLIQHEKMSSLGQMVAGIAHEINNPVNFITGNLSHASSYIEDLLDFLRLYQKHYSEPVAEIQERAAEIDLEFLAEDLPKIFDSMQIGAERIRQIVLSLRNFSRLDEAEMKPVNIHEGIDNTLLILQHRLKPSNNRPEIKVIKEYGELPKVNCYAGQLNQVFMNVISNSIDALEEAKVKGTDPMIRIRTETTSKHSVVIRIIDNGLGMKEEVRKRLFDPFFTTKAVGKGTGLGLSISYQIVVEKHGGSLKCISEPNQGAEFVIEVPTAPVREP